MAPSSHPFTTVRDLLRYAVSRFTVSKLAFGHGSLDALDEAAYLILHTLHLPLDKLDPFLDAKLMAHEIEAVLQIIERRCMERLPAAYITNEAWLHNYRFYVDSRVIVPRSFIAELIPNLFQPWVDADSVTDILELCTGSGCLSIMLADAFPDAQIDAVDLSPKALEVAKRNVDDYELTSRIRLIESDVYQQVPPQKKYDIIVSNPPYVNSESMGSLPEEYRHEPGMALDGGEDGMDIVRRIIEGAKARLNPDGVLLVEIGHERTGCEAAFPDLEMTWLTTSAGDNMVFLLTADQLP
jgi:ribosomal protein L3 glutamine methyltransferase